MTDDMGKQYALRGDDFYHDIRQRRVNAWLTGSDTTFPSSRIEELIRLVRLGALKA